jgi:hypothetical protein
MLARYMEKFLYEKKRFKVLNKTMLFVLSGMVLATIGLAVVAGAGGLQLPTEEIIIRGDNKSARFAHSVHIGMGLNCGICHHDSNHEPLARETINGMENSKPLRCVSCHNKDFSNPKLQTRKAIFHARCKSCHKKGLDGKHGPTKCNGCHVKHKK